jgi:peptidoglycan glycosyltransferase
VNAPLRRVGIVVLALFGLLFVNLNYVQAYKANDYRTSQYNGRVLLSDYQRQRGTIYDSKGVVLANSVATDESLKYQRKYPLAAQFEPLLGYRPVSLAATGIERAENTFLSGNSADQERLADIFSDRHNPGGNVYLTLNAAVQKVAYDDLSKNGSPADVGGIVAIEPTTGRIIAMASSPSFDPNDLASHDYTVAQHAYNAFDQDKSNPLLNRAISETYPPGSTFKVIVSAAALENGYTPDTLVPAGISYAPVNGSSYVMHNAEGDLCPETQITLLHALTVSCNTAYGQLGVKLGSQVVTSEAQKWGFGDDSLTIAGDGDAKINVAPSEVGKMTTDSGNDDANFVAQSSIGQYEDRMTPLFGAMVAATVANGGVQMKPYLVDKLTAPDLTTTYTGSPSVLRTPISPAVDSQLQQMMFSVVQSGTGTSAQVVGYEVGGKTGTAQSAPGALDHRWFIGFAIKDGKPLIAVAVLLANAGHTGNKSASKIGGDVLRAGIASLGGK